MCSTMEENVNQQFRYIMQLQKKARQRRKDQVYIIEGIKLFEEVPKDRLVYTCVSESFIAVLENKEKLGDITYDVVKDAIFAELSDTKTPQGILAIVKQFSYNLDSILKREEKPLFLLLETIQDPGNLGTMIRTAEAAGVTGVIMNTETVDLYNPKVVRATMGSMFRVPCIVAEDFEGLLQRLKGQGIAVYAAHLDAKEVYDAFPYEEGTAFIIGNEANGISDKLSAAADQLVKIPMCGQVESLNAATAATILLFEAASHRRR